MTHSIRKTAATWGLILTCATAGCGFGDASDVSDDTGAQTQSASPSETELAPQTTATVDMRLPTDPSWAVPKKCPPSEIFAQIDASIAADPEPYSVCRYTIAPPNRVVIDMGYSHKPLSVVAEERAAIAGEVDFRVEALPDFGDGAFRELPKDEESLGGCDYYAATESGGSLYTRSSGKKTNEELCALSQILMVALESSHVAKQDANSGFPASLSYADGFAQLADDEGYTIRVEIDASLDDLFSSSIVESKPGEAALTVGSRAIGVATITNDTEGRKTPLHGAQLSAVYGMWPRASPLCKGVEDAGGQLGLRLFDEYCALALAYPTLPQTWRLEGFSALNPGETQDMTLVGTGLSIDGYPDDQVEGVVDDAERPSAIYWVIAYSGLRESYDGGLRASWGSACSITTSSEIEMLVLSDGYGLNVCDLLAVGS